MSTVLTKLKEPFGLTYIKSHRKTPILIPSTELKNLYIFGLKMEKVEDAFIWGGETPVNLSHIEINSTLRGFISFVRHTDNHPDYKILWVKRKKNERN